MKDEVLYTVNGGCWCDLVADNGEGRNVDFVRCIFVAFPREGSKPPKPESVDPTKVCLVSK